MSPPSNLTEADETFDHSLYGYYQHKDLTMPNSGKKKSAPQVMQEEYGMALKWWRSLNAKEQDDVYRRSEYAHWTFSMFQASTLAIRRAWLKEVKANQGTNRV
jgi:hypothetical protein